MNGQRAPAWPKRPNGGHQRALAWDRAAADAEEMIAKPRILGDEMRPAIANRTKPVDFEKDLSSPTEASAQGAVRSRRCFGRAELPASPAPQRSNLPQ